MNENMTVIFIDAVIHQVLGDHILLRYWNGTEL